MSTSFWEKIIRYAVKYRHIITCIYMILLCLYIQHTSHDICCSSNRGYRSFGKMTLAGMRMPGAFHLIGASTGLEEYRSDTKFGSSFGGFMRFLGGVCKFCSFPFDGKPWKTDIFQKRWCLTMRDTTVVPMRHAKVNWIEPFLRCTVRRCLGLTCFFGDLIERLDMFDDFLFRQLQCI